ncbi:MAG: hypothetical protein IK083_08510 [Abditibacteriota bacterium]|nr:hypothetical protein [Abditibacteriota bacterium]
MIIRILFCAALIFCAALCYGVSVTDFGALPDGSADASDAFNAAVLAAAEEGDNTRLVTVPAGKYLIDKPVQLTIGTVLKGDGRKNTTIIIKRHDFVPFTFGHAVRVEGMLFTYPNNQETVKPHKAEPTLLLTGINPEVVDVAFDGSWTCISTPEGVETNAGGGLFRDIGGWSHYRGIVISGAKDINKFENIHWFVGGSSVSGDAFYAKNRVCFDFGNVDGVMMDHCFVILAKTFFQQREHFTDGEGNKAVTGCLPHMISNCWCEHVKNGYVFQGGSCGVVMDGCQVLINAGGRGIDISPQALHYNATVTNTQVRGVGGSIEGLYYNPGANHPWTRLSVNGLQVAEGDPCVKLGANAYNFNMSDSHLLGKGGLWVEKGADKLIIHDNIIDYWPGGYSIKNPNKPSGTVIFRDNIEHKL